MKMYNLKNNRTTKFDIVIIATLLMVIAIMGLTKGIMS